MKTAQLRMMGQAPPAAYDPEGLRQEALRNLRLAWSNGAIYRHPGSLRSKRKRAAAERVNKRTKT